MPRRRAAHQENRRVAVSWPGGWNRHHILEYFGPPPPSGGTQVMLRLGSLMSQVLQWTQFCALITKRGWPPSSTHS